MDDARRTALSIIGGAAIFGIVGAVALQVIMPGHVIEAALAAYGLGLVYSAWGAPFVSELVEGAPSDIQPAAERLLGNAPRGCPAGALDIDGRHLLCWRDEFHLGRHYDKVGRRYWSPV